MSDDGWRGVLIEGREFLYQKVAERFGGANPEVEGRFSDKVTLIHQYAAFEGPRSLDAMLAQARVSRDLDFISIDIDSNDWYLWDSMTVYQPRAVLLQYNAPIPNDVCFVQDRDLHVQHSSPFLPPPHSLNL